MLSSEDAKARNSISAVLLKMKDKIIEENPVNGTAAFMLIKKIFDEENAVLKKKAAVAKEHMNNALLFLEKAYSAGQETVILVTELTADKNCARFISKYGCEQYFRFNKELLIHERQTEILREIDELNLD